MHRFLCIISLNRNLLKVSCRKKNTIIAMRCGRFARDIFALQTSASMANGSSQRRAAAFEKRMTMTRALSSRTFALECDRRLRCGAVHMTARITRCAPRGGCNERRSCTLAQAIGLAQSMSSRRQVGGRVFATSRRCAARL